MYKDVETFLKNIEKEIPNLTLFQLNKIEAILDTCWNVAFKIGQMTRSDKDYSAGYKDGFNDYEIYK